MRLALTAGLLVAMTGGVSAQVSDNARQHVDATRTVALAQRCATTQEARERLGALSIRLYEAFRASNPSPADAGYVEGALRERAMNLVTTGVAPDCPRVLSDLLGEVLPPVGAGRR